MSRALVPVRVADRWLLVDASLVQEILGRTPWVSLPGAPHSLPGVLPWRGSAVAVLDLAAVTGMGRPRPAGETSDRFLVCQVAAVTVALPVDMAREVVHVAPEAWAAVPSPPCRHATQEALVDARPMLLLDLTALVSEALAVADPR